MGMRFNELTPAHKKVIILLVKLLTHWADDAHQSDKIKNTFLAWWYFTVDEDTIRNLGAIRFTKTTTASQVATHLVGYESSVRGIQATPCLRELYPTFYCFRGDVLDPIKPKNDARSSRLLKDIVRSCFECVS